MNAPLYSPHWKVRSADGHIESPTGKTVLVPDPTASNHASSKAYADKSRGLVLSYAANKTFSAADFSGRDLSMARVTAVFTAAATATLPNDASRVVGARLTFERTYNGNLIIDGNGANVQGRSHSFGATNWFQGTNPGSITYEWNGIVWVYVGIPASVDGQVQAAAVYDPNAMEFISNDGRYRAFMLPATRSAYNAALANTGTLTCDYGLTTNNRNVEVVFKVRVGVYKFDCAVLAHRDNAGVVTLVSSVKPIWGAGDYAAPPAISLAASIVSSTTVRLTLTNSSGANQVVSMGAVAAHEDTA